MAERMPAEEFARAMKQFYESATDVLIQSDAYIDKLVADEVVGLCFPLFAGKGHARRAVEAARELLRATGCGNPGGPVFPAGVGVHKGTAFVGTVAGAEGTVTDIAALGHDVHIAAAVVVYRLWRDGGYAIGAALADLYGNVATIWVVAALTFTSGIVVLACVRSRLPGHREGSPERHP